MVNNYKLVNSIVINLFIDELLTNKLFIISKLFQY